MTWRDDVDTVRLALLGPHECSRCDLCDAAREEMPMGNDALARLEERIEQYEAALRVIAECIRLAEGQDT